MTNAFHRSRISLTSRFVEFCEAPRVRRMDMFKIGARTNNHLAPGKLPFDVMLLVLKEFMPELPASSVYTNDPGSRNAHFCKRYDALIPLMFVCKRWLAAATHSMYYAVHLITRQAQEKFHRTIEQNPALALLVAHLEMAETDRATRWLIPAILARCGTTEFVSVQGHTEYDLPRSRLRTVSLGLTFESHLGALLPSVVFPTVQTLNLTGVDFTMHAKGSMDLTPYFPSVSSLSLAACYFGIGASRIQLKTPALLGLGTPQIRTLSLLDAVSAAPLYTGVVLDSITDLSVHGELVCALPHVAEIRRLTVVLPLPTKIWELPPKVEVLTVVVPEKATFSSRSLEMGTLREVIENATPSLRSIELLVSGNADAWDHDALQSMQFFCTEKKLTLSSTFDYEYTRMF